MTKKPKRKYEMRFAGQLIKHLGLQMYGGAVPAIAELVSNAWDAMARKVDVSIPLGRPLEQTDVITVSDDGTGMGYDTCNREYLVIGRERRRSDGDWTEPYNGLPPRRLQGRKGIGKLAGFGIADRIEIRTVRNGEISHFAMDYEKMISSGEFVQDYKPDVLAEDGLKTGEAPNTCITLRQLKITRSISEDDFMQSMARRFAIISSEFRVSVNGKEISKDEVPFQIRLPESPGTWQTETLSNGQEVRWWAGFSKAPIAQEEARGFVVYVRGKLAQAPWFFDLSGGIYGQHGLQYLAGEVRADFLDDTDGVDLIATDRASVRWEHPLAFPLKEWGRRKIRSLLEEWVERRHAASISSPAITKYLALSSKLPDRERAIFRQYVDKICSIPQLDKFEDGRDIVDVLVEFGYNALTNRAFLDVIRQLNASSPAERAKLQSALAEWDIIEAINTALVVKGRVEIIRKFAAMVDQKVPEKPDLHEYLRQHPWLIDPKWTTLVHEKSLDSLIAKEFGLAKSRTADGRRRLDFFCLGDRHKVAYVVELKQPGLLVTRRELDRFRDYILFLRKKLPDYMTKGFLICDRTREEDEQHVRMMQEAGTADVRSWAGLLFVTQQLHEEFLQVVKERAPADDPRLSDIE